METDNGMKLSADILLINSLEETQWKDACFVKQKQSLINKACKWLKKQERWDYYNDAPCKLMSKDKIAEFRKVMENENIKA